MPLNSYRYFHFSDGDSEANFHSRSVLWMGGHLCFTDELCIVDVVAKCFFSLFALSLLPPLKIFMKCFLLPFTGSDIDNPLNLSFPVADKTPVVQNTRLFSNGTVPIGQGLRLLHHAFTLCPCVPHTSEEEERVINTTEHRLFQGHNHQLVQ